MIEICNKEHCSGCGACTNACPKQCIIMSEDEIGHFFPEIDQDNCVDCGLCKRICPAINEPQKNIAPFAYAAVSKNNNEYITSSSGGAASVFSRHIIDNGGVVYGCTGTNGTDVCHIKVNNADDLWKLKGSKYVESRLGDTFKNIRNDLEDGKMVLFIGTPCQVAGAKSLFSKYDSFYCVDLICHGVPSQKLLKEHISNVLDFEPDEIKFRNNTQYGLSLKKDNVNLKVIPHFYDLYFIGFSKALYFRKSCYNCKYAANGRTSDITVGDFWGIKNTDLDARNGLSVILPNTEKGKKLVEDCNDLLFLEKHDIDEAINGNPQLRRPSFRHKNTDKFRKLYPEIGFEKAAKRCLWKNRIKYFILAVYLKITKKS